MGFIQQRGGYRKLKVFAVTTAILDITDYFVKRFLTKGDRTIDQMVQAARSGRQNICEGSMASITSRETEIKLTNVARASLEELKLDYQDYLRHHGMTEWESDHSRYEAMRAYARSAEFMANYREAVTKLDAEAICNLQITLIHQASCMLWRLIKAQERQFIEEGGIREAMSAARRAARGY